MLATINALKAINCYEHLMLELLTQPIHVSKAEALCKCAAKVAGLLQPRHALEPLASPSTLREAARRRIAEVN